MLIPEWLILTLQQVIDINSEERKKKKKTLKHWTQIKKKKNRQKTGGDKTLERRQPDRE